MKGKTTKNNTTKPAKTTKEAGAGKSNQKMNKNDFVDMITAAYKVAHHDASVSKKQVTNLLICIKNCLVENLRKGVDTTFTRFGSFVSYVRNKREAKNPNTGKQTTIPARRVPKVKFHKSFKDLIF